MRVRISGWARTAMSTDASRLADRLHLVVVGTSPQGPWVVRHPDITPKRGRDLDAMVLAAAKELTDAD